MSSVAEQQVDSGRAAATCAPGAVVRVSANDIVTPAQADSLPHLVGVVGVVQQTTAAPVNAAVTYVTSGLVRVLLETGLTPNAGDRLYVSASVAGRATNVGPATAFAIGVIKKTTGYSNSNPYVYASIQITGVSGGGTSSGFTSLSLPADDLRAPTIGGWYTMGIATLDNDYGDRESALPLRSYPYQSGGYSNAADPPTMLGAGTPSFEVPAGAANLELVLWSKNFDGGLPSGNVGVRIAITEDAHNTPHSAWTTYNLPDIAIPANYNSQRTALSVPLGSIGMTPGRMYTLQFCRVAPSSGELTGWWSIILVVLGWS